jgi:hypothetical protein
MTAIEEEIISIGRDKVRERGFVSAVELVCYLVSAWINTVQKGVKRNNVDFVELLKFIPDGKCFHSVEYANKETEDFRRKDLFYYCPPE